MDSDKLSVKHVTWTDGMFRKHMRRRKCGNPILDFTLFSTTFHISISFMGADQQFVVARKVGKNPRSFLIPNEAASCDGSGREFPTHTRIINRQNQAEEGEIWGAECFHRKNPAI